MADDQFLAREILGYGAYLLVRPTAGADVRAIARAPVSPLVERLALHNEFSPSKTPAAHTVAFLRRHGTTPADVPDEDMLKAEWAVHVFGKQQETVTQLYAGLRELVKPHARVRILAGVVQPKNYTGAAMQNWAYARAVTQQPGAVMPNAFIVPMNKTADWWRKDWMEQHTYFLPRYDDDGRMVAEGHALATEKGIACLLRRTYRSETHPAPEGSYDFVTYFECADVDVPVFHEVCAALRDVKRNPEWTFVREGPAWHGRRVPSWETLFSDSQ
jgi:hypothetical protein